MQAYCVKCKTKREMSAPKPEYSANGRAFTRGVCPVCGTTMTAFGETSAHASISKPEPLPKAAKNPGAGEKTTKKAAPKSQPKRKKSAVAGKTTARANGTATAAKTASKKKSSAEPKGPIRRSGKLVIVESPAKARSVGNYLGSEYTVKASKGHVRDLLVSQLSVDVENNFEPKYRVPNDKRETVKQLTSAAQRAKEIYLATDPDREGEAIAWHLIHAAEMEGVPVKRVVFHEITRPAIEEAFHHPRELDMNLVNAQQARRILDRLVGYNITELLWDKVRGGRYRLSAGRVQSVAVRLIVDREREILAFVPREYWTIDARLQKQKINHKTASLPFLARLIAIEGKDAELASRDQINPHLAALKVSAYQVSKVARGERQRKPSPPFTTSTLQQEASRRLGFSAGKTMSVAQQLYEGVAVPGQESVGLITYMRTDSMNISQQAQKEARDFLRGKFGKDYVPAHAPVYKTRAKGAQEAHEAIRPTMVVRDPASVKAALTNDQYKLYNLVWQRFVASQMSNAVYNTLQVDIDAVPENRRATTPPPYGLRVSGSTIKFAGFLALYEDSKDEDLAKDEDEGRILPEFEVGEMLSLLDLLPIQHFTQPPPRFTEASLVRTLEELGIGRPSTYAPTVGVIQDREYVTKQDKRLIPTETGITINDLLVKSFPKVMDYQFTANMEEELDEISEGAMEWQPMLGGFYAPFSQELAIARQTMPAITQEEPVGRDCPTCSKPLMIRYGKFGKFIGCSDYPNCRYTEPYLNKIGVSCPTCGAEKGGEILVKRTRRGKEFFGCSRYPECDFTSWQRPLAQPCPHCGGLLVQVGRNKAKCTVCGKTTFIKSSQPAVETTA